MSDSVVIHPEAFHTPERKTRLLLASLPFFAGLLSEDGTVLECNFAPLGEALDAKSGWVGRGFETGPWWNYSEDSRSDILIMLGHAREGNRVSKERLYRKTGGDMGVMMLTLAPLFAPYGQPDAILVMAVDVTDRRRASDTSERIALDMAHRLRNSFTVMRSLATRGLDGGPDGQRQLTGRLSRIRDSHDLAFRYLFFPVPIGDIVNAAVPDEQIAHADFVPVSVPSEHAEVLMLALGELAHNGRAAEVTARHFGEDRLRLVWKEDEARPDVLVPSGLSRVLVMENAEMQTGGRASLANDASGFRWTLDFPVRSAVRESPPA